MYVVLQLRSRLRRATPPRATGRSISTCQWLSTLEPLLSWRNNGLRIGPVQTCHLSSPRPPSQSWIFPRYLPSASLTNSKTKHLTDLHTFFDFNHFIGNFHLYNLGTLRNMYTILHHSNKIRREASQCLASWPPNIAFPPEMYILIALIYKTFS